VFLGELILTELKLVDQQRRAGLSFGVSAAVTFYPSVQIT